MLCELAVGLSSLVLLPVLAVGAFFLVKGRMRPRDAAAGMLHRPQWERDVVYLVQFPTAPHCRTISPFALKLETWLRAAKIEYEPVYSLKFSTATGQIPYVELNGAEIAGTLKSIFHCKRLCESRLQAPSGQLFHLGNFTQLFYTNLHLQE